MLFWPWGVWLSDENEEKVRCEAEHLTTMITCFCASTELLYKSNTIGGISQDP